MFRTADPRFQTTDLSDEHTELHYPEPVFHVYGAKQRFCGPLHTVRVFEDNVLYVQALESVPAGSVVVVDDGGSRRCALMGDRLGNIAARRGLEGVIINGCVRDSAELAKLEIGVLALGTHPRKSGKRGAGERNVPLSFAGVVWTPGHFVYADEDGLILSEQALA